MGLSKVVFLVYVAHPDNKSEQFVAISKISTDKTYVPK